MPARTRPFGPFAVCALGSTLAALAGPAPRSAAAPVNLDGARVRFNHIVWVSTAESAAQPNADGTSTMGAGPATPAAQVAYAPWAPRFWSRLARASAASNGSGPAASLPAWWQNFTAAGDSPWYWNWNWGGNANPGLRAGTNAGQGGANYSYRGGLGGFTIGAATPTANPGGTGVVAPVAAAPVVSPAPAGYSSVSVPPVSAPLRSAPAPAPAPATAPAPRYDAFLNFGPGPYPEASLMTTGGATAWYNSPAVQSVFGGMPDAQEQADFTNKVLQDVKQTFKLAGLEPKLTLDPNEPASHTLSVVSGTSYSGNPSAIGITDVGRNGFGFIDKLKYADSPDELATAVAHNVSHELMHAFGVGTHPDQTGEYLDSATANWSLLTDPNATFSSEAARQIASELSQGGTDGAGLGAQGLDPDGGTMMTVPSAAPVPEPAAWLAWTLALTAAACLRRRTLG